MVTEVLGIPMLYRAYLLLPLVILGFGLKSLTRTGQLERGMITLPLAKISFSYLMSVLKFLMAKPIRVIIVLMSRAMMECFLPTLMLFLLPDKDLALGVPSLILRIFKEEILIV